MARNMLQWCGCLLLVLLAPWALCMDEDMEMDVEDVTYASTSPTCVDEVFDMGPRLFERMERQPEMLQELKDTFAQGLLVNTDYTGMACVEMAITMVIDAFRAKYGTQASVRIHRGTEILPQCRAILCSKLAGDRGCPQHVFGNLIDFVSKATKRKLTSAHSAAGNALKQAISGRTAAARKKVVEAHGRKFMERLVAIMRTVTFDMGMVAKCHKCNGDCRVFAPEDVAASVTVVWAAGTPCTSWSSAGAKRGWVAESAISFVVWMFMILAALPCVVIHECTERFDVSVLKTTLGEYYHVFSYVFTPKLLGLPQTRMRRWTILLRKTRRALRLIPFSAEGFGMLLASKVVTTGYIFYCAPMDVVSAYIRRCAARRCLAEVQADGSDWSFEDVVAPCVRLRLLSYRRYVVRNDLPLNCIFNLQQAAEYWNHWSDKMPALMRRTTLLWSDVARRSLLPLEHLCVQGVPIFKRGRTDEERFNVELMALQGDLSDTAICSMSGNGMVLAVVASVFLFAIGGSTRQSESEC